MQKNYFVLFMLLSITISPQIIETKMSNDFTTKNHDDHSDKKKCCDPIRIYSKDINHDGKGFKIKESGYYLLCEDTIFEPHGSKTRAAIKIKSEVPNVILDLGAHTLSQSTSKNHHTAIGILANNNNSISIINGSVTDFNVAGIQINNNTDVTLNNIDILRTGNPNAFGGLQINDSSDVIIDHIRALNNFGCGMYLHGVIKTTISNSHFDDNVGGNLSPIFYTGPGQVGAGAFIDSSDATETSMVLFQNCSFNRNSGGGAGSGAEVGPYSLLPVKNVTFIGCEFLDNFMLGETTLINIAIGLVIFNVNDYFFVKDCIASGQRSPALPGPIPGLSGAAGFSIAASNNGIIENCQTNDNVGGGFTTVGTRVRGCFNVLIKNCEASRNVNTGSNQSFGFYTDTDALDIIPAQGSALIFDSCVAQQNSSTGGSAGGFKISHISNSTVKNCISQENDGVGILVIDDSQLTLHNIFKNNIAQGNTVSGIDDEITASDNAYTKNIARTNGIGGIVNYVNLPSGTPIVTWSISGAPLVATNPFANLDITP